MKYHSLFHSGLRPLLLTLALIPLCALVMSCSEEMTATTEVTQPKGTVYLNLTFNVGDNSPVGAPGRATPEGEYDRGQGYENYIALEDYDFHFYFFDTEKKYLGELTVFGVQALESPGVSSKRYTVVGSVKSSIVKDRDFKIVAVANWRHRYPRLTEGESTIDDLCQAVYDFSTPFMPAKETPVPMYGVKSFSNLTFRPNEVTDIGLMHLLRAMAKIEVTCASPRWTIQEAAVTRYNKAGHQAPVGVYEQDDYVHNNWPDDYVKYLSIPEDTEQGENLPLTETRLNGGSSVFTVFVPEFRNIGESSPARIEIKFKEKPDMSYVLEFANYDDNGHLTDETYDINRNFYYRYTVTKKDEWSDIDVVLDVEPYSEVLLTPDFGLDRDDKGRIIFFRDGPTVYLLDQETGRCFTENASGQPTYVQSIRDRALGQYIYYYDQGIPYYWHRAERRWYFRCENGEMFYVSFKFNGTDYYYDPNEHKCYTFSDGNREYVDRIVDGSDGKVLYHSHNGIAYFYDEATGEYYYRTSYGERVFMSMTIGGVHYHYDLSKKKFYNESTKEYLDEIKDPATGKVVYRHDAALFKSFFLDSSSGEYYYRNPLGDKVYVTMTVVGTRYFWSFDRQRYFHKTDSGDTYVDIITDTSDNNRIVFRFVNGIAYFWDSRKQKYCYRDSEGLPTYVENLPNN